MLSRRDVTIGVALLALALVGLALPESLPAQTINFCTLGEPDVVNWLDVTPAERTVTFVCCLYEPRCVKIDAGQTVTFSGNFSAHPLVPGLVKGGGMQPGNPIPTVTSGTDPVEVTFPDPGSWGYYCDFHQPGMAGAVFVAVFADGFESGDTTEWSATVPLGFPLDG